MIFKLKMLGEEFEVCIDKLDYANNCKRNTMIGELSPRKIQKLINSLKRRLKRLREYMVELKREINEKGITPELSFKFNSLDKTIFADENEIEELEKLLIKATERKMYVVTTKEDIRKDELVSFAEIGNNISIIDNITTGTRTGIYLKNFKHSAIADIIIMPIVKELGLEDTHKRFNEHCRTISEKFLASEQCTMTQKQYLIDLEFNRAMLNEKIVKAGHDAIPLEIDLGVGSEFHNMYKAVLGRLNELGIGLGVEGDSVINDYFKVYAKLEKHLTSKIMEKFAEITEQEILVAKSKKFVLKGKRDLMWHVSDDVELLNHSSGEVVILTRIIKGRL